MRVGFSGRGEGTQVHLIPHIEDEVSRNIVVRFYPKTDFVVGTNRRRGRGEVRITKEKGCERIIHGERVFSSGVPKRPKYSTVLPLRR